MGQPEKELLPLIAEHVRASLGGPVRLQRCRSGPLTHLELLVCLRLTLRGSWALVSVVIQGEEGLMRKENHAWLFVSTLLGSLGHVTSLGL